MKKNIIIKGPFLSQSGYGFQSRFALRALRKYEEYFDIFLINLNWGNTSWIWEDTEERRYIDFLIQKTTQYISQNKLKPDISLQITIPQEFEGMAPINIGYTAGTETDKISPKWLQNCLHMNKLICTSEYTADAFRNTKHRGINKQTGVEGDFGVLCPIEVCSYGCELPEPDPDFDLNIHTDFNFLFVSQLSPRKNHRQTIEAFIQEFHDEPVGLIVKTNIAKNSVVDRYFLEKQFKEGLEKYKDRKCSVYLLHGDLSENEMSALYRHPKVKALINLAHGEGFGLPIFEAVQAELPIITLDFSGQRDFLHIPDKDGKKNKQTCMVMDVAYEVKPIQQEAVWDDILMSDSKWAFPVEWNYRKKLRDFYKNPGEWKSKIKKLKKHNDKVFEKEKMYKQFAEAVYGSPLSRTQDILDAVPVEKIPGVSIITSVFDGDEFIRPFLEDITRQTIFKEKCELILVNANSPGNEERVINEYLQKFDNIKYVRLDSDPGIYGVWNFALQNMVSQEFVMNANLDDRKAPDQIEKLAKYLVYHKDVSLVYNDSLITDKPNETFESNSSNGRRYYFEEFSPEIMLKQNLPHSNPLWRFQLHNDFGYFDDKYRSAGDWEYWLMVSAEGIKFKKYPEALSLYYWNPKGLSTDPKNFSWKFKEEKEIRDKYTKLFEEKKKQQENKDDVLAGKVM
jgi:glycosyltransferase involved in cell wall biosynthesis